MCGVVIRRCDMFARTGRYEVPLDRIEDDIRQAADMEAEIAAVPGNRGFIYFADRATGHTMSLTLWEDEAALRASEIKAKDLRRRLTEPTGAKVVSVEEFETVVMPAAMR
jgi:heme-degrading monooxygenase HmoA